MFHPEFRGGIDVGLRSQVRMPSSSLNRRHATPLGSRPHSLSNDATASANPDPAALETSRAHQAALERVYRSEALKLKRYFSKRVAEPEDAIDLVQESFARLAGQMCREALAHPASYLQRIARNLLFDRAKSAEVKLKAIDVPIDMTSCMVVEPDQCHAIEAADLMRLYHRAIDTLPVRTRDIFLLHRGEELSYREIAHRLGIAVPTVQYHVAKALVHIATALSTR